MGRTKRFAYGFLAGFVLAILGNFASEAIADPVGRDYSVTITNLPGNGDAVLTFDGQRKPIGASGLTVQEKLTKLESAAYVEFSLQTQNGQPLIGQQQNPDGAVDLELHDLVWDDAGTPGALMEATAFLYFTSGGEPLQASDMLQAGLSFATHPLAPSVPIVVIHNPRGSTTFFSISNSLFPDASPTLAQPLSIFFSPEDAARVTGIHVGFAATQGGDPPPPPPPPGENQLPVADAGADRTVEANKAGGADVTLAGTGTDPDGDALSFTWTGPFGTANGANPTVTLVLGSHTLTLTVEDGNGGSDSDEVVIDVVDTTPPVLTVPADQTLEATGPDGAALPFEATASDIADPAPVVECVPPSGSTYSFGTTTVSCNATDGSGNHSEGSFTITVQDTTSPVVTAPPDVSVAATGPLTVVDLEMNGAATAVDAVGVVLGPTPDNSGPFAPGIHTVTWTAQDAAGNVGSDVQTVSVLFNFSGFFPPVDNLPAVNRAKAGQGIPIKWQVSDGNGGFVSDPGVVQGIRFATVGCDTGAILNGPGNAESKGRSGLRYDPTGRQFVFVWSTPGTLAGQCAEFIVNLSDGSSHRARFTFR